MLFHPVLMGLIAALVIGLALSFALGLWRSDKQQAAAGMVALCGLKWRDFAHLVEDLLQERGFSRAPEERNLGDGGFDLLMARGSSRYLVQCKNGAAHRVTDQGIRDLAAQVESHGAEGAVLATSGGVEASARLLASNRRIEILADEDLWRQVRSFLPHDVREEVLVRSRAERLKRSIVTGVGACVAGLLTAAVLPTPAAVETASPVVRMSMPQTVANAAKATTPAESRPAVDTTLSESQLAARRTAVAMEVRNNPVVANASWATKSTLVVSLRQSSVEIPDALFDEICRIVLEHEEQRYTRLQIESPAADGGSAAAVRWKQCR